MRKHFTLPVVLSGLALVVALSGTAVAATSVLIKHNSQVAAHTIAGAAAPKHDNENIIAGSIGSGDLHAGAVTNSKLGSNAVTGSKIAAGAVTRAKLSFPTFDVTKPKTDNTERTLVSTDGLTLTYKCSADFGDPQLAVFMSSSESSAFVTGQVYDIDHATTTPVNTAVSMSDQSLTAAGSDTASSSTDVTLTYQAGTHVGLVTLEATANHLVGTCTVQGAFVPLT